MSKMQRILIKNEVLPSWNALYQGVHWSKRKKLADYWHKLVFYSCKQQKIKPVKGIVDIRVTCTFKGRALDSDNLMYKLVGDGLVLAGILKDDSPEYVNSILTCSRKGKINSTEIIINELKTIIIQ